MQQYSEIFVSPHQTPQSRRLISRDPDRAGRERRLDLGQSRKTRRPTASRTAAPALFAAAVLLAGCTAPHPFIRDATATSVDVAYSGDLATAMPLAEKHCAEFGRVPRLIYRTAFEAQYDCVTSPHAP